MMKSMAFGWELTNLVNDGADLYSKVFRDITILGIEMDVSFMPLAAPVVGGWAEVLCGAYISSVLPKFAAGPQGWFITDPDNAFSASSFYTPPNKNVGAIGGAVGANALALVILKTWVATNPIGGESQRNVVVPGLSMFAPANSYLVFHMDHAGKAGDAEMQSVIYYREGA